MGEMVFLYGNEYKCMYQVQCIGIIQFEFYSFMWFLSFQSHTQPVSVWMIKLFSVVV